MTVTIDTIGAGNNSAFGATTYSWAHTVGASATDLVVSVVFGNISANPPNSLLTCKIGTTTVPSVGAVWSNNQIIAGFVQMFVLHNPPTGAQTITITSTVAFDVNDNKSGGNSITFNGSLGGIGSVVTAFGSATPMSIVLPSTTSGDICVVGFTSGTGGSTTGASGTVQWDMFAVGANGSTDSTLMTQASTGSAETLTCGFPDDWWSAVAFEMLAAGVTPTPATPSIPVIAPAFQVRTAGPAFKPVVTLGDATLPTPATGTGAIVFNGSGFATADLPVALTVIAPAFRTAGIGPAFQPTVTYGDQTLTTQVSGTGAINFNGSGTATVTVAGTGTGAIAFAGSGTATGFVVGTGTGAITFAGSGTAINTVSTTGTGAIVFGGSGAAASGNNGVGTGAIVFNGSGTASVISIGTGSGAIAFNGSGTPTITSTATGSGAIAFNGAGTATVTVTTTGTGAIVFSGAASSGSLIPASGSGAITFNGSGVAATVMSTVGNGLITFGGAGTPRVTSTGVGTGAITFSGTGATTLTVNVTGTGAITFGASGIATISGAGTGQVAYAVMKVEPVTNAALDIDSAYGGGDSLVITRVETP